MEINTDDLIDITLDEVYKCIEPLVIHIRSGTNENLKMEITEKLSKEHGFVNLNYDDIVKGENERGTDIGKELYNLVQQ